MASTCSISSARRRRAGDTGSARGASGASVARTSASASSSTSSGSVARARRRCSLAAAAVTAGARRLRRAAVVTDLEPPAAPCGACRQVLAEFGPSIDLVLAGPSTVRTVSLADLLPLAFGPEQLA